MADIKKDQERDELHKAIWAIADELRGSVDGWDFKSYVLGMMFYRYISENLTNYINEGEIEAGNEGFDYAQLSDDEAEQAREDLVQTKGFFILPSDYEEDNPKCRACHPYVQAWFLIGVDDISANSPRVSVVKQSFKLPDKIKLPIETEDKFSEWLGKAEIAYKERLGAGAVIYLRSAFEQITLEVGHRAGVEVYKPNGRSKPFDQVIRAVDAQCSIIPVIYSDDGYKLFQRLSNIVCIKTRKRKCIFAFYRRRNRLDN